MSAVQFGSTLHSRQEAIRHSHSCSVFEKYTGKLCKFEKISPERSLEEDIFQLRQSMEHLAHEEQSLNSELVVMVSRLLDQKINEYMRKVRN